MNISHEELTSKLREIKAINKTALDLLHEAIKKSSDLENYLYRKDLEQRLRSELNNENKAIA